MKYNGNFFAQNHPGYIANSVTFCQEQCDILPEDDVLLGIPEIIDDTVENTPVDEGPMVRKNDDPQDIDHGFVSDYSISKPQREQIANFLWPEINPEPVNEFEISGIASLAFVKLWVISYRSSGSNVKMPPNCCF